MNEYLNICVMKQNRKKKFFPSFHQRKPWMKGFSPLFHQEGRQFRHHEDFIFILFSVYEHRVLESWNASLWCIFRPRKKISTRNDIISSSSSSSIIIIIIMRCFCFSCRRRSAAATASGGGDFARSSVEEEEVKEEEVWFDANEVFVEEKEQNGGREAAAAPFSSSFSSSKPALFRGGVSKWTHGPLRLENALSSATIDEELPINDTRGIEIRTNAFAGKLLVRCRDVPSREGDEQGKAMTEKYFANKKRTFQTVVQGRFLRKGIKCSEVVTGHEFESRFRRIPARWLVSTALKVIRKLTPGLEANITGNKPFILRAVVRDCAGFASRCSWGGTGRDDSHLVRGKYSIIRKGV